MNESVPTKSRSVANLAVVETAVSTLRALFQPPLARVESWPLGCDDSSLLDGGTAVAAAPAAADTSPRAERGSPGGSAPSTTACSVAMSIWGCLKALVL